MGDLVAEEVLEQIEEGELGLAILPWILLTQGADRMDIIEKWKTLGETEVDRVKKSDYGSLATVFAEKVGLGAFWRDQLKEWSVEESMIVKEWTKRAEEKAREEGREEGQLSTLLRLLPEMLVLKFGSEGAGFAAEIQNVQDPKTLRRVEGAIRGADSIEELRTLVNASAPSDSDPTTTE